ncbi:MAG: cobalt ECF transporter T component CbiQ, partial [Propionivibrio sp.]|nr:cobalt ECF transporter T component CbiQ [Propionivibrio sp.]
MLIEQCAYSNRWRAVSPAAKGLFALGGFIAAFAAARPQTALTVAGLITLVAVAGAGVPLSRFARIALPPLGFLLLGCLSLAFSLGWSADPQGNGQELAVRWLPDGWAPILTLGGRSLGALAALLFLAATTPLIDLIALLRRLRLPEILLELMVLCYRMLF